MLFVSEKKGGGEYLKYKRNILSNCLGKKEYFQWVCNFNLNVFVFVTQFMQLTCGSFLLVKKNKALSLIL